MFLIYHVTSRDHVFKELCWINGLKLLIVSHHFAKLCGHRRCRSSDTAAKIVYMTLQDHVIKVTLWKETPHCISPPYGTWQP